MRRRDQWIRWMQAVEQEAAVVAFALEVLQERLKAEPSLLSDRKLQLHHFHQGSLNREPTYLVRLFATFESGLREVWNQAWRETTNPRIFDLLLAIQSRCRIPHDLWTQADRTRKFRNQLVHEQQESGIDSITLEQARRYLCRFFSHVPEDW